MTDLFEAARRAVELPELWRRYGLPLTAKSNGRRYETGYTPCCGQMNRPDAGSLYVDRNKDEWRWHCFHCGKGGSAIDLMVEMDSITHLQAAQRLVREAGGYQVIQQREPISAPTPKFTDAEKQRAVREIVKIFLASKTNHETTLRYLTEDRGISRRTVDEALRRGLLRTLPRDPDEAASWLDLHVGKKLLEASGMLTRRRPAAAYRPIVFIPPGGTCLEFRVADTQYTAPKALQYGNQTYPLVWMPIGKVKHVMPLEGGIDMLSVVDLGLTEDTMILGMLGVGAWQDRWVDSIQSRYPGSTWLLGFDNDAAGVNAAPVKQKQLIEAGIPCDILTPWGGGEGTDWNDTLKAARAAF